LYYKKEGILQLDETKLKIRGMALTLQISNNACVLYTEAHNGIFLYVTEFWKITHMGVPETIRIFEFSMALLIVETTFKNNSNLYL